MLDDYSGNGLIISLDPGRKKTGVALGNRITNTARPLVTVSGYLKTQVKEIARITREWEPETIVVGLPDAKKAKAAHHYCRVLAGTLEERTSIPIVFYNEDYTTQAARAHGDKDGVGIDAIAASILAQDWLSVQENSQE